MTQFLTLCILLPSWPLTMSSPSMLDIRKESQHSKYHRQMPIHSHTCYNNLALTNALTNSNNALNITCPSPPPLITPCTSTIMPPSACLLPSHGPGLPKPNDHSLGPPLNVPVDVRKSGRQSLRGVARGIDEMLCRGLWFVRLGWVCAVFVEGFEGEGGHCAWSGMG